MSKKEFNKRLTMVIVEEVIVMVMAAIFGAISVYRSENLFATNWIVGSMTVIGGGHLISEIIAFLCDIWAMAD